MQAKGAEYKFKGTVIRSVYDSESFRIYGVEVDTNEYPFIKLNKYRNATIKGELPVLTPGVEYEITANENSDKYGVSYYVSGIKRDEPMTRDGVYAFLSEVLTLNQADTLIDAYPNILELVKNQETNTIDVSKLHGIGQKSIDKIVDKITENFYLYDLVSEFKGIITMPILKKIYNKYKSVSILKQKLNNAPYSTLTKVSGIGYKTADAITLTLQEEGIIDFGYDIRTSVDRCAACIIYLLTENENEGHTKMNLAELRKKVFEMVPACADKFAEAIQDNDIYYSKENFEIARRKTYEEEVNIATTIFNNISNDNVWECDTEKYRNVGEFDLSDEQLSVLDNVCKYNVSILNGAAGCVDCDTEFFTGTEWKRIADYKYGDKVLQYNENGTAELVYPIAYIKNDADYLWHFETKYGLDQCLSDNHNCYYITSKGNLYHKKFKDVRKDQENNGFYGKFITSFDYSGFGIDLTDDEIRLMVAVFADGSYMYSHKHRVRFHLKKDRKKKRLVSLLNRMGVDYKEIKSATDGYTDYYFTAPFRAKHYPDEWYNCNKHQLEIIADEVMYWDGEYNIHNHFSTTNKKDADFIQFVYSAIGYRASISVNNRTGKPYDTCGKTYTRKSMEYTVVYTKRNLIGFNIDHRSDHAMTKIVPYKTIDGYEYCFTVPSHMLVLRRNNKIFVTGNCGKSQSTKAIINMLEDQKKVYTLLTPTGKAAKVLANFTHRCTSTIHRGLGYKPDEGWYYNKEHKLMSDIVIVDEVSMVDINVFSHLVDAIDFNNTKLLMVGDNAQLPSVGCGNLLHDFMQSELIPTVSLSKIFRYGDGGLLKVATDIRMGKEYLDKTMKQSTTPFGTNADYVFMDIPKENSVAKAVSIYKKLIDDGCNVEDVQVITAKNKGDYGTIKLNSLLQKVANPNYGCDERMIYGDTIYYKGDFVIENKNNYKAPLSEDYMTNEELEELKLSGEKPTAFVANGESGIIKNATKNFVDIDFNGVVVRYNRDMIPMINLGYAITCHKSQGSSINNVILVTTQSDIFMLNSNLVYVGCTRARKRCFHIGSVDTMNKVVHKKENFARHTFMQQLLKDMADGYNQ